MSLWVNFVRKGSLFSFLHCHCWTQVTSNCSCLAWHSMCNAIRAVHHSLVHTTTSILTAVSPCELWVSRLPRWRTFLPNPENELQWTSTGVFTSWMSLAWAPTQNPWNRWTVYNYYNTQCWADSTRRFLQYHWQQSAEEFQKLQPKVKFSLGLDSQQSETGPPVQHPVCASAMSIFGSIQDGIFLYAKWQWTALNFCCKVNQYVLVNVLYLYTAVSVHQLYWENIDIVERSFLGLILQYWTLAAGLPGLSRTANTECIDTLLQIHWRCNTVLLALVIIKISACRAAVKLLQPNFIAVCCRPQIYLKNLQYSIDKDYCRVANGTLAILYDFL